MTDPAPDLMQALKDTATLRQRLAERVTEQIQIGPYSTLPSDLRAEVDKWAVAITGDVVAFLREQAEGWRAAPDPLALDVYTDVVRDEFRRLADSIEAGDL